MKSNAGCVAVAGVVGLLMLSTLPARAQDKTVTPTWLANSGQSPRAT